MFNKTITGFKIKIKLVKGTHFIKFFLFFDPFSGESQAYVKIFEFFLPCARIFFVMVRALPPFTVLRAQLVTRAGGGVNVKNPRVLPGLFV